MFNYQEKNKSFRLEDIPKTIKHPLIENQKLHFIGCAAFKGSEVSTPKEGLTNAQIAATAPTGHYVSYVFRRGSAVWMEIDDLCNQARFCKKETKIVPRLLLFVTKDV